MNNQEHIKILQNIEQKILWLSTWMIHHANHIRPNPDGLKVGGHQASSASSVTILTSLFFAALRSYDKISIKPHASPVFHAIQYLMGRQKVENLINFRSLGGAQSYPSRTKDLPEVDFSTGSVGLGVSITLFTSLLQDYLKAHQLRPADIPTGRMVALLGDAELDEGNIYESLLEGWKHNIGNLWWIVDYNRQSLDNITKNNLNRLLSEQFKSYGWRVVELKYGYQLQEFISQPGGDLIAQWLDQCPHDLYSALTYKRDHSWRQQLLSDIKDRQTEVLLSKYNDHQLHQLMTNLAGHDFQSLLSAFSQFQDNQPTCFIAHTIKGYKLPFAGHKDNHAGLLTPEQINKLQQDWGVPAGQEWDKFAGLSYTKEQITHFITKCPYLQATAKPTTPALPDLITKFPLLPFQERQSTQEAFGRLMGEISKLEENWTNHLVTTSPDVTVSTNLGGWVNKRNIFAKKDLPDLFRNMQIPSAQRWQPTPKGQHIELGIAENNLFTMLAAFGLSESLFNIPLVPIGTLYDPFIARGLDALIYGCYQDSRFIVVSTPSGISLSSEGGAHQSIITPLIGIGLDNLCYYEPAFADELTVILHHAIHQTLFSKKDDFEKRNSFYLRLSTKSISQPNRVMETKLEQEILKGGYWLKKPSIDSKIAIVTCGVITAESIIAWEQMHDEISGLGLLVVTSPDQLYSDWLNQYDKQNTHIGDLLKTIAPETQLITVIDGHPSSLSWLGAVRGQRVHPLGVSHFGQSASPSDLYRIHRINHEAIVSACAQALVDSVK